MSYIDDQLFDHIDADFEEDHNLECRICSKAGFRWSMYSNKWLLIDSHGEIHRCPKRKQINLLDEDIVL